MYFSFKEKMPQAKSACPNTMTLQRATDITKNK